MSSEKKVVFLFLLLIALIVFCVYTHLPKLIKNDETIVANTPTEIDVRDIPQVSDEKIIEEKEQVTTEENTENNILNEEENSIETEPLEEENSTISENNNLIEEQNSENVQNNEENIIENEKKEEIKIVEPLITTKTGYIREKTEQKIENMSLDTQKIQLEINQFIKEKPIIFKRAGYKTTKKSDESIKMVVDVLKNHPNIKIEIAGHTDAVGAASMNQEISLARAQSVRQRLIFFGIDPSRLVARGYGEGIPLVKNSPNGYSKANRRVEFNIVEE